jgi:hypothetical protein
VVPWNLNALSVALPAGTIAFYLNLFDDRGCVVSSEHEEL